MLGIAIHCQRHDNMDDEDEYSISDRKESKPACANLG